MVERQSISLARAPRWAFWLFSVYVVSLALLPAGNIGGINVKIPVFAALTLAALSHSLHQEHFWVRLAAISAIVSLFTGWLLLTFFYPFAVTTLVLEQYRDVLTTLAGCWFIRLFTQHPSDRLSLARLVLYAIAFESLIKVMLFFYSMHSGVPVSAISDRISALFRTQLMTADLGDQSVRLQLVSDSLLPSAVFAIVCLRRKLKINAFSSAVILSLLLASSMYTFSRYFWACTAVAILLGMFVSQRDWLHTVYIGAVAGVAAYYYELLSAVIGSRFSESLAASSDLVRVDQIHRLNEFFWDAPFFGHGLGSYTTQVIRSADAPYVYEVQLLALAGQVGLAGMAIFAVLLINYYRKAVRFKAGQWRYQISVLIMLALFLGAGLFNPGVLTSTAALSYGFLFVLASLGSCRSGGEKALAVMYERMI